MTAEQAEPKRCDAAACQAEVSYLIGEDYLCADHFERLLQGERIRLKDGYIYQSKIGKVGA